MAGAAPTPGKGGKRPLDASLNLVPFIDLLSCCISFLLITAVWVNLARLSVTQKQKGAPGEQTDEPPTVQLTLFVNPDGYQFSKSTGENVDIPLKGDEYDYVKLADTLKEAKTAYPDKNDIQVKADDKVIYNKIVNTMDIVLANQFPDINLGDKGAAQ